MISLFGPPSSGSQRTIFCFEGDMATQRNPLLEPWDTPFELPPFRDIQSLHFGGAFEQALAEHSAEIEAIANSHELPDFKNTLIA
ncbi:MAG: hypothetical protein EBQ78_06175, partial [Betaproteobacteria bacterium]|nr:hypothetical protein [Betaproteobacteria bacterium]NBY17203.1 hypothetical protein [Betaproteobacteria bacterium]